MPDARIAEFLLRRATTLERASAIAGDLLEQHPQRPLRFACAVARIMFALQWKQLLAFAAAPFAFILPAFGFAKFSIRYITPAMERHARFKTTASASPLLFTCMCLLAVSVLALARPATRRVAIVSMTLAATTFLAACTIFLHQESGRYLLAAALVFALLLIATPASRKAAIVSLAATMAICLTALVVLGLGTDLLHPHGKYILRYDLGLFVFAWLSSIAAGTAALGALQRRFSPTPPPVIN